ncbi:phage tail protein [Sinomicrobium sp. M5D2P9]
MKLKSLEKTPQETLLSMSNIPMGCIFPFILQEVNIPKGWLLCNGMTIPQKYQKLIAAIGKKTPNLCGRALIGAGTSTVSKKEYKLQGIGGEEEHKLVIEEMPKHSHSYVYRDPLGKEDSGNYYSGSYWAPTTVNNKTEVEGGDIPHNNMQPYFVINYIIYTGENN